MRFFASCAFALSVSGLLTQAGSIGLEALRHWEPNLTGSGVAVAQAEAGSPAWQANPAAVGVKRCHTTWNCSTGSATNFPNSLGSESAHAGEVGRLFLSIAPDVAQFDNYEASYFATYIVPNQLPIAAKVVNQSFTYFARNTRADREYDHYAARYNVLFVSGAGNGGWVPSPGTAYNGISVAAYGGASSVGPSTDGRCKPDIAAPASATSFSTPLVSGAAALLTQAGAEDIRLLKALLLNGAEKPADWTNAPTMPLDQRYGAGIVNVFNSWRQFRGGRHSAGSTITARRGWDLATIGSNEVRRYVLDTRLTSLTATLVWLRNHGCTNISNLNLAIRAETGEVVAASTSVRDNVEHLHLRDLPLGRYSIEVSSDGTGDTYALAFEAGPATLPRLTPWNLTGEPNQAYWIETSLDLRAWSPWLTNTTSAVGTFEFPPLLDGPMRFFRAVELP